LNLKYDKLLSNCAFNCKLRPYKQAEKGVELLSQTNRLLEEQLEVFMKSDPKVGRGAAASPRVHRACLAYRYALGRCSFTPA